MRFLRQRFKPQSIAISLKLLRRLLLFLDSIDLPTHDRTAVTNLCANWLASTKATEAGEFLLAPAAPAAFNILARSASAGGSLKASTSQCGEDLIISHIFVNRGIRRPTYLDIGAHNPLLLSNTAIFYTSGSRGINVEPNPDLIGEFYRLRPGDINLQMAISDHCGEINLFVPDDLEALATVDHDLLPSTDLSHRTYVVPCIDLLTLIRNYANGKVPDFLSLDVEGHDLLVLRQLSSLPMLPKVICVETVSYSQTGHGIKLNDIIDFLVGLGYSVYADTNINTIFVLSSFWAAA